MKVIQIIISLVISSALAGFGSMFIWVSGTHLGYTADYRILAIAIFLPICILLMSISGYLLIGRLMKIKQING